jgi:hypothetical protein
MSTESEAIEELWDVAYVAAGPDRDEMWDWLARKYLAALEREAVSPAMGKEA